MPTGAHGLCAPTSTHPASAEDPYRALVAAILHRAVRDAQGYCVYPGSRSPLHIEAEARAWLQESRALADLLELAGFDAEPVMRPVRRLLHRTGTP